MKSLAIKVLSSEQNYNVYIGPGIRTKLPQFLAELAITKEMPLLLVSDSNVAELYLAEMMQILAEYNIYSYVLAAGEESKSLSELDRLTSYALEQQLDRQTVVLALGGGVVGDFAGFFAASYMRGVRYIQLPTTILAHDSSVGGKVAINHQLGKNMLGAFHHPMAVIYDTKFLQTLPEQQIKSGLAELLKHGLIADCDFVLWLKQHAEQILSLDNELLTDALFRGIAIKLAIVSSDLIEKSVRAYLNYGHTLAHALETATNYRVLHGEAVAIGIRYSVEIAASLGLVDDAVKEQTIELLRDYHLPTTIPSGLDSKAIFEIMQHDKKAQSGQIRMVLPTGLGSVKLVTDIPDFLLREKINELQR
jgi:3-dehydroquinate synthase